MPEDRLVQLLLTQTWQIAVLTIIVAGTVKLLATKRPRLAHLLWLIVVIKCVTPPVWNHSLGVFNLLPYGSTTPPQAVSVPADIDRVVEQLSRQLKLRRTPRVIVSDVRFGPAVLGVFRSLIVLPKCLVATSVTANGSALRPADAGLIHMKRRRMRNP